MKKNYFLISILCVIFISLNLRAPITAIGPLVDKIMLSYELNSTQIGILSSLPLLCFFIFSLIAPILPNTKAIFSAIILIIIGLFTRAFFNTFFLFFGTILIGLGIAILNVLMPSFIKNNFKNIGKIMAIYGMILSVSSLIGVFGHYLAEYIGLSGTLFCWVVFAIIALFCYLPFIKNNRLNRKQNLKKFKDFLGIFKNQKAWIITGFMGLQSCVFYTIITWYPSILATNLSNDTATNIVILFQFCAMFSAYFIPSKMANSSNNTLLLCLVCFSNIFAFFICLLSSNIYILIFSALLFSIPVGGIFGVALTMIAIKSKNSETTVYLSSMAQSVGYLIATIGPIIFGYFKDLSGNFDISIIFMIIISSLLLIFALLSNKISYI